MLDNLFPDSSLSKIGRMQLICCTKILWLKNLKEISFYRLTFLGVHTWRCRESLWWALWVVWGLSRGTMCRTVGWCFIVVLTGCWESLQSLVSSHHGIGLNMQLRVWPTAAPSTAGLESITSSGLVLIDSLVGRELLVRPPSLQRTVREPPPKKIHYNEQILNPTLLSILNLNYWKSNKGVRTSLDFWLGHKQVVSI